MDKNVSDYGVARAAADISGRSESEESLGDLVAILTEAILRRWRLVLLVAGTMLALIYLAVQVMSDKYDIETSLLVTVGRENLEVPTVLTPGTLVSTGVRKEDVNSDVSLLGSRALIEQTVNDIGVASFLAEPPPPTTLLGHLHSALRGALKGTGRALESILVTLRLTKIQSQRDKVVTAIERGMFVRREGESDVILITLRMTSPDLGVRFLDKHVQNFLLQRGVARRTDGAVGFFSDRADAADSDLLRLDTEISSLRSNHGVSSIQAERDQLLKRLAELNIKLADAKAALTSAQSLSAFLPATADGAQTGAGAGTDAVREKLGELIIERASLLDKHGASGKAVRDIEGQIGQLTELLQRAADREIETIGAEQTSIEARLTILSDDELKLDQLFLDRELARGRYADYTKQREAAAISGELEAKRIANVSVLSPPTQPPLPTAPRKLMIVLVTIPLGIILGIALAALFAFFDERIFTARELARVKGVTLLGTFHRDTPHG